MKDTDSYFFVGNFFIGVALFANEVSHSIVAGLIACLYAVMLYLEARDK